MAVNPMQRKARNMFLLGMLLMLVIGGAVAGFLIYQITGYKDEIALLTAKQVYVLNRDIASGETIEMSDLKMVKQSYTVANVMSPGNFSDEYVWKAKTNLTNGVILTEDMVYMEGEEVRKDTRIQEYNMVKLPSKLENGNYIDIRLSLPTGQDYVVVSRKEVLECDTNTIWIRTTEEERLMMGNAIVEHYVMTGSDLYAVIYDEAGLQEAAAPTYVMSNEVRQTFQNSPNLMQTAIAWYNALDEAITSADRTSIQRQLNRYSDNSLDNIENGRVTELETQIGKRLNYISSLNASQN